MHCYGIFKHSCLITYIIHNSSALGVIYKIQVIGFLQVYKFIYDQFVDLDDSLKVIVHYLLIGEMTYLGHPDEFLIVIVLVCIITH